MPFSIDTQTARDLELFNENRSARSILSYFNQTKTFGGKLQLKKLMDDPLDNIAGLIERRDTIRFFTEVDFAVTITAGQMDFIDHYFRLNRTTLHNNWIDGLLYRFWVSQAVKNDMYLIQTGVEQLVFLLLELEDWLLQNRNVKIPEVLNSIFNFFNDFLQLPDIAQMLQKIRKKPKSIHAYRYDVIFRSQYKRETQQLIEYIYTFDAYQSVATTAAVKGLIFPEYVESPAPQIQIEGLFHPLISDPVPIDLCITTSENLGFLSGPNMAGKSTFLKALGLAVYLSHLGFPVPAKSIQTSVYHGLISTINLPDNMEQGYSHFYSEVRRIKDVALKIKEQKRLFVIFDELFRGTNVKDAYDASLLIIQSFAQIRQSTFLISTHITEIAEAIKDRPNILFKYFDVKIIDGQPVYSYRLLDGVSHERLGMFIFKRERIVEILQGL